MSAPSYVHGYAPSENRRLHDQARTLAELLHADTRYPAGARVLEVGCGTGAQTLALARNSPDACFTSVDLSATSIAAARASAESAGFRNVTFGEADVSALPFAPASFDHVFVCFLLEHLRRPGEALVALRSILKPGGTITAIEGDHGLIAFHPESAAARASIRCQGELQRRAGGDANLGRRLRPLLVEAGYRAVAVSPRMVYVDGGRPDLATPFTLNTFTAMIAGVRDDAIAAGLTNPHSFDDGIAALRRTAEPDGVFCYTFFKAIGVSDA